MASTCVTSLDLCAVRVSRLTTGGAPLTGATNGYVSNEPLSLGVTITTEAGDDLTVKNGCGGIASTYQQPDQIKGVELSLELCELDAYLLSILTDSQVFTAGGNAIGMQATAVGTSPDPVCFEAWTKAWDSDHQYTAPYTSPDAAYWHWVFPFVRWVQGDLTLEHNLLTVPVNGKGSENTSITVNGPFNDWPAEIAAQGGITRLYGMYLDDSIPTGTCNYVSVTSLAS